MKVTCDSSVVTAYVFTADAATAEVKTFEHANYNIKTSKYSCGDIVRVQPNKGGAIVLI